MNRFPFLDLNRLHRSIAVELNDALGRVVASSTFINGPEVKKFEYQWADYCGASVAIGAANGTAALHAILACLDLRPGEEVICPSHTFVATAEAIRLAGARPIFSEINPETWVMDPAQIERHITSRTRAILPVHLYGMPCDMDAINALAASRELWVVEDAAQAHGARYKGKRAGSLGFAAAFSFFPGKNLGAIGDAGAVTTNDANFGERLRLYVNHGRREKYEHQTMGTNYRLDTIHAAVLLVKLKYLDQWNARRAAVADRYRQRLQGEPFLSMGVRLQRPTPGAQSANHLFVISVPRRDEVMQGLQDRGVACGIHYPIPCHLQPSMSDISRGAGFLVHTERLAGSIISLPLCPTMVPDDADRICDILTITLNSMRQGATPR